MTKFQNKTIVAFIAALCRATAQETLSDAERAGYQAVVDASIASYKFIPTDLYRKEGEVIKPTAICLSRWHNQLKADYSVQVPFRTYDNSVELGKHVLHERTNTLERIKLLNGALQYILDRGEVITDVANDQQVLLMERMGHLYNYLLQQTPTGQEFQRLLEKEEATEEE